jgi:hypothetical protein
MWREQVRLDAIPYYYFVERDTGPSDYFGVPLVRATEIFTEAYRQVSGLARTVRGPVMSATAGKVCVDGVAEVAGQKVFVLRLLQARDAALVGRPFFARYDPEATWLSDLSPAFGGRFPFDQPLRQRTSSQLAESPATPDVRALVDMEADYVPHIWTP